MKTELKPYPAYKASDLPWVSKTPLSWGEAKLKHAKAKTRNAFVDGPFGSNLKSEHFITDGEVFVIESGFATQGVLDAAELKTITRAHFETIRRSETKAGDIIIAKIGAYFGKSSILPPLAKPSVVSGNSLKLTVDRSAHSTAYIHYLLSFLKAIGSIDLLASITAQPALSLQGLNSLRIILPPKDDQDAIVAFLDRETAKIDRLMEVRRKQVERLQEQRAAVIHHAVTKGLDPDANMKPSGVEWLPQVPEGWIMKRLKFVAACNRSVLGENTPNDFLLDYIDIGNVTSTGQILEVQTFEFKDAPSRARRKICNGSVIVSTVRTYLKAIAFIADPAANLIVSTGFAVLDAKPELRAKFLYHALASEYFIQRVIAESKGVGYPAINASDLINIVVAYPRSLTEQDELLQHIEQETTKFDAVIAKYRRELELLAEYRASLISHAVTGKIDVRGLVPPVTETSP